MSENTKASEMTIDETFQVLESITAKMEDPDISLEESFALYKEGMEALQSVSTKISDVEKQVLKITEDMELAPLEEMQQNLS